MAVTFKIDDGDVVISSMSGRPITISGKAKTRQDVREVITLDEDPGAGIASLIGTTPPSGAVMALLVEERLRAAVGNLIMLRARHPAIHGPDESIMGISSLVVRQSPTDPREITFLIDVSTADGTVRNAGTLRG